MRRFTLPPCLRPSVRFVDRSRLPKKPGVYYAISVLRPWRVLYVGMSGNLHKRWNLKGDRLHHKTEEIGRHRGVRLHYATTTTRDRAARLEAIEIARLKPSLNIRRERLHQSRIADAIDWLIDIAILGSFVIVVSLLILSFF